MRGAASHEECALRVLDRLGDGHDLFNVLVGGTGDALFLVHDFFEHEVCKVAFFGLLHGQVILISRFCRSSPSRYPGR